MSIFTRIGDLVSANVNALFDKWEDPVTMTDEYIRKIAKELGDVRTSTAEMEAQRKAAERAVGEKKKEIADWHAKATAAVKVGNNDHARVFLQKKNDLMADLPALEEREKIATANAVEIRKSHDKLVNDMRTLQSL